MKLHILMCIEKLEN